MECDCFFVLFQLQRAAGLTALPLHTRTILKTSIKEGPGRINVPLKENTLQFPLYGSLLK